ncbi:MAG: CDP-alcohol phosphatidyltransferase family protein [Coriobacteriia bacterium]|nr:CDP-alcohol phosphatidyltransferase family protein [Coriobacteriia bacterium]
MARTGEDRILTVPNVLSVFRICLIPVFIYLLLNEQNIYSFLVFILASITDGIDGFVARHFNQTTRLGKILDPIADRGLILAAVIVLTILSRLPLWIMIIVLFRDLLFLIGGGIIFKLKNIRVNVIMLGKVATAIFYVGLAALILAWPWGMGFGWINVGWLPGFNNNLCFYGIYLVYIAIILNIPTFIYYTKTACQMVKNAK